MVVAVGDSIPFNSEDDCPGCTGFVDRYATELGTATGKTVGVRNLSQHNGLQVQGLLDEIGDGAQRAETLAEADAIIVGIAHNDIPWNVNDDACDGAGSDNIDWSKYTAACFATEVKRYTPKYEAVFERIAALRAGKPTVLRAINRYNDWTGWPGHPEAADGRGRRRLGRRDRRLEQDDLRRRRGERLHMRRHLDRVQRQGRHATIGQACSPTTTPTRPTRATRSSPTCSQSSGSSPSHRRRSGQEALRRPAIRADRM